MQEKKQEKKQENLKVKIFKDTFEDFKTKELIEFVRYQVKIEEQIFDLFLREESKRLLKYLFEKNNYFDTEEKFEELKVVNTANGLELNVVLFGKAFRLLAKKNDAEMVDYLLSTI